MVDINKDLSHLFKNFFTIIQDAIAIIISDTSKKNEILFSFYNTPSTLTENNMKNDTKDAPHHELEKRDLSNIISTIKPVLDQFVSSFKENKNLFGSVLIETELFRLFFVSVNKYVFIFTLDLMASIDESLPYIFLTTEKAIRILNQEQTQTSIPRLSSSSPSPSNPSFYEKTPADLFFKVILLGNSGVGKTSLVSNFVHNKFETDFRPTIGLNIMSYRYHFLEHTFILNLYDIGSQKIFRKVRRFYYKGAHAALVVFDLNDPSSFESVEKWINELKRFVSDDIVLILVGNKSDLPRQVSFDSASKKAHTLGASYIETSALTSSHVKDAFSLLCYQLLDKKQNKQTD